MRETKEEKKEFYRKLFALVLPLALQNLMTALVSASDALMLGMLVVLKYKGDDVTKAG